MWTHWAIDAARHDETWIDEFCFCPIAQDTGTIMVDSPIVTDVPPGPVTSIIVWHPAGISETREFCEKHKESIARLIAFVGGKRL